MESRRIFRTLVGSTKFLSLRLRDISSSHRESRLLSQIGWQHNSAMKSYRHIHIGFTGSSGLFSIIFSCYQVIFHWLWLVCDILLWILLHIISSSLNKFMFSGFRFVCVMTIASWWWVANTWCILTNLAFFYLWVFLGRAQMRPTPSQMFLAPKNSASEIWRCSKDAIAAALSFSYPIFTFWS